jgi:hypothetical protein
VSKKNKPARSSMGDAGEEVVGKRLLMSSPSFLISLILHLLIVLGAAIFYVEKYLKEEETEFFAEIRRPAPPKLAAIEKKDLKKDKAAPKDAPIDDEDLTAMAKDASEASLEPDAGDGGFSDVLGGGRGDGADSIGVGSGGRRRPPAVSRRQAPRAGMPKSVHAALEWLARHQNDDGSWSVSDFHRLCGRRGYKDRCAPNAFEGNDNFEVGISSLALLAFLGAGYNPLNKQAVFANADAGQEEGLAKLIGEEKPLTYGEVVKRALKYLTRSQDPSGRLGLEVDRHVYNHTIGAIALAEAYGTTGIWLLRWPAQRAIDYLASMKRRGGGWRYDLHSRDTDSSVTGWAVMALKSAETAKLSFDPAIYNDVRRWYERATTSASIRGGIAGVPGWDETRKWTLTGYLGAKDAGSKVSFSGLNEHYAYNPALTAVMVMCTVMMDRRINPPAESAIDSLLAFMPRPWSPEDRESWKTADFYYWYHASYALFQVTSVDDPRWKSWNAAIKTALVDTQNVKGFEGSCKEGSWEPIDRWSCEGGRVYATALAALTLEVHYRYPKVLGLDKKAILIKVEE